MLVVSFQMLPGRPRHFDGQKAEAALLEALDDLANEVPLHAIRFHHDECPLTIRVVSSCCPKKDENRDAIDQ